VFHPPRGAGMVCGAVVLDDARGEISGTLSAYDPAVSDPVHLKIYSGASRRRAKPAKPRPTDICGG
jgi:hypothetical protein